MRYDAISMWAAAAQVGLDIATSLAEQAEGITTGGRSSRMDLGLIRIGAVLGGLVVPEVYEDDEGAGVEVGVCR